MRSTQKLGWAVITGASAGLGTEYARQLAARGYDVVIIARRRDRLEALATEVKAAHGVDALVLEHDLSKPRAAEGLAKELDRHGIVPAILVNNAGVGQHGFAVEAAPERIAGMLELNMLAPTELAITLGAKMATRGSGAIVNIASTAAFQPTPHMAAYAATKAYLHSFSRALSWELAPRGVHVISVCPGGTRTEFFEAGDVNISIGDFAFMSAKDCVAISLRALDRKSEVIVTGLLNKISAFFGRVSPQWMVVRVAAWIMKPRGKKALAAKG